MVDVYVPAGLDAPKKVTPASSGDGHEVAIRYHTAHLTAKMRRFSATRLVRDVS